MKPKVSTGYLTPQIKQGPKGLKKRLSVPKESEGQGFDQRIFEDLLKCPEKKQIVLQLLAANKDLIKKHQALESKNLASPVGKLKTKQKIPESPTALLRRRALEGMNDSPTTSSRSNQSRSASFSSSSSESLPFDKILKGVIAYVEIRSRNDEDRSAGAKVVLKSMGAIVREKFTDDVTHVIFKDGSYNTFHRAKLRKLHLVSILWVEFCRKTRQRQNEKQYRALKSTFEDETVICSQMQKEYEDIIRDEYKKSMDLGTPLPTTTSLIHRRRTLMTPSVTDLTSSSASYKTAEDKEDVISRTEFSYSNLDDCSITSGADIDKDIVHSSSDMDLTDIHSRRNITEHRTGSVDGSDMELTNIPSTTKKNECSSKDKTTPLFDRRKTLGNFLLTSNPSTTGSSTNLSKNSCFTVPKKPSSKNLTGRQSFSSFSSNESIIFGRKSAKSKKHMHEVVDKTASAMSELKLSTETSSVSMPPLQLSSQPPQSTASMSSLRLSSDKSAEAKIAATSSSRLTSTSPMPSLRVSSERAEVSCSMAQLQLSSEPNRPVKDVNQETAQPTANSETSSLQDIRNSRVSRSNSVSSDESEIISPRKVTTGKTAVTKPRGGVKKKLFVQFEPSPDIEEKENEVVRIHTRRRTLGCRPTERDRSSILQQQEEPTGVIKKMVVRLERSPDIESKENKASQVKTRRRTRGVQETGRDERGILKPVSVNSAITDNESQSKRSHRKLYNPDDFIPVIVDDAQEREERIRARKRKPVDDVSATIINPVEGVINAKPASPTSEEEEAEMMELIEFSPPKRTRSKKTKEPVFNASADEQTDLLNEVLSKQDKNTPPSNMSPPGTPSRRKSMRIQSNQKSQTQKMTLRPVTPLNRRSTLEFMSTSQMLSSRKKPKKKLDRTKWPTIVCTKLHKPDVQLFAQIVKKLGRFNVEDEVSDRTTHLVAGESKRTINMLRAVARGCWVLKFEWVLQSLENERWLPEEDYEITDFSPVVQKSRLERQAFGSKYTLDVFETAPSIYVAPSTNPRCSDLKELITTCKGKVVTAPRMAKVIVGQYLKQDNTVCVSEAWVLDSITFYRRMPYKHKYLLTNKRQSVEV